MIKVLPIILCGGSGTRLWPLSRLGFPKQFLTFFDKLSLFQKTLIRINELRDSCNQIDEIYILTGEEHRFIAKEQLKELSINKAKFMLEPEAKNTAPALTFAALNARANGEDPVLIVTPADHIIKDQLTFLMKMRDAIKIANEEVIVTFGITPTEPQTGLGYIKTEGPVGIYNEFNVIKFIEKPNLDLAKCFVSDGGYAWNSGIFVLRASVWLKAIECFSRDIFDATIKAYAGCVKDGDFLRPDKILYKKIRSESIDYAVIQHCPCSNFAIKMIELNAGWTDLGSWHAVWEAGRHNEDENVFFGDVITEEVSNSLVYGSQRLISLLGVDNIVVVDTADALLIANKEHSQNVKNIVSKLEDTKREEHLLHRRVTRPWGWFDTIDIGYKFKVKRVQVAVGSELSLQKHNKRSEHWVVVKGIAKVKKGNDDLILKENESTFIAKGEIHRISNIGEDMLEIIEVQTGDYLGEDDIIRYEDSYGRVDS